MRYTDRYKQNQAKGDATETWTPGIKLLPQQTNNDKTNNDIKWRLGKPELNNSS